MACSAQFVTTPPKENEDKRKREVWIFYNLVMLNFSPVPAVVVRKEGMFRPGAFAVQPGGPRGVVWYSQDPWQVASMSI